MFCPNCGADNGEGAKFCLSCGTNLQAAPAPSESVTEPVAEPAAVAAEPVAEVAVAEPAAEAAPKENKFLDALKALWAKCAPIVEKAKPVIKENKPIVAGVIGGIVLFIVVCIIISAATSGNGFTPFENYVTMNSEDGTIVIIRDNKVIKTDVEADSIRNGGQSLDGSVTAFLTDAGTLHVFKGSKVVNVAEEVVDFVMSSTGKGIAYIVEDGDEYVLNLYNVSSKKNTVIATNVYEGTYDLSPDGKSVCYYEYDEEDDTFTLMYATASKNTKITSSEVELAGLSNSGKYIYAVGTNDEGEEILYSFNTKGEREKLDNITSSSVYFNEDHTQILFFNDGKTYISTKGKEAVKISSSKIRPLVAPNAQSFSGPESTTYPVKSLFDHVYTGSDSNGNHSAWFIRKNTDKSCKLVSNISNVRLDQSAEYLYYIYDSELRVIKISHGDSASEKYKTLGEDVSSYVVTSDRSKVYYLSAGALYSCNGKTGSGKKTVASDDVSDFTINGKDVVFYSIDGDVYATSNGRKGKKVGSDIQVLISAPNGIVYAVSEDVIYVSNGSKSLKKLYEME